MSWLEEQEQTLGALGFERYLEYGDGIWPWIKRSGPFRLMVSLRPLTGLCFATLMMGDFEIACSRAGVADSAIGGLGINRLAADLARVGGGHYRRDAEAIQRSISQNEALIKDLEGENQ